MRNIILVAIALIWLVIASIPRGSDQRHASWFEDIVSPGAAKPSARPAEPVAQVPGKKNEPAQGWVAETGPDQAPVAQAPVAPAPAAPAAVAEPAPRREPEKLAVTPRKEIASALADDQPVVCTRSGEPARSLIIDRKKTPGCELIYAKRDGQETVARSQKSPRLCVQIRDRISRKLEAAGYRCAAQPPRESS
jgi:hypothetical protein